MRFLKQSTAATVKMGPFLDSGDAVTPEGGLTISQADIRLSKNGGDIAQSNNAAGATHDELGYYDVPLDTTDTNTVGRLRVIVHESGALPVWEDFTVLHANVYDVIFGSVAPSTLTAAQVNTEADTALADYDGPTNAEMVARTLAAAAYATAANQTLILADTGGIKSQTDQLEFDAQSRVKSVVESMATDVISSAAVSAAAVSKIQAGLSTVTTAQVNAEIDTALADVGLTTTVTGRIDAAVSTRATPVQVNAEVLDVLNVDTLAHGRTVVEAIEIIAGLVGGECSGAGTGTETFLGLDGSTEVAEVTVDEDGNRTSVSYLP